jgi:hypothetical protein
MIIHTEGKDASETIKKLENLGLKPVLLQTIQGYLLIFQDEQKFRKFMSVYVDSIDTVELDRLSNENMTIHKADPYLHGQKPSMN